MDQLYIFNFNITNWNYKPQVLAVLQRMIEV